MKTKVRWDFARNMALKVREVYGLNTTRLAILDFIDKISDLRAITYDEMVIELNHRMPDLHADVNWVINNLADGSQDAAIIKMSNSEHKIILYHDKTPSIIPERIRFTIAHELGHYFLKHTFSDSLGRNGISEENYNIMEKEAETFAQTLLIPPFSLFNGESIDDIIKFHDVSKTAAKIALEQTHYQYRLPTYRPKIDFSMHSFTRLPTHFSLFNRLYLLSSYAVHCKKCNGLSAFNYNKPLSYCNYCGSDHIHVHDTTNINFSFYERVVPHAMIYKGIDVDTQGKVTKCPTCDNENIVDGSYCQICGKHIVNKCSGYNSDYDDGFFDPEFIDGSKGCGTVLSGESRYCPICGCESTFFLQDLLPDWKKIKDEAALEMKIDALPF